MKSFVDHYKNMTSHLLNDFKDMLFIRWKSFIEELEQLVFSKVLELFEKWEASWEYIFTFWI